MICCECRMIYKAQKHIDNELRFYCSTKNNICLKKNRAKGFTWKKVPAQAVSEKKISCKLKIPHPPPPPITFLMVRPLGLIIPSGQSVSGHVVQAKMFASDTSPKLIDPEGRGKRRTWTRQGLRSSLQFAVHGWTAGRASSGKWLTARVFPLKIVQPHE